MQKDIKLKFRNIFKEKEIMIIYLILVIIEVLKLLKVHIKC